MLGNNSILLQSYPDIYWEVWSFHDKAVVLLFDVCWWKRTIQKTKWNDKMDNNSTTPCFWMILWLIECVRTKSTPTKNGSTSKISRFQNRILCKSMDFFRISTPRGVCFVFSAEDWPPLVVHMDEVEIAVFVPCLQAIWKSFSMQPDFRHLKKEPKR